MLIMLKWLLEKQLIQVDGNLAVALLLLIHCLILLLLFVGTVCFVLGCNALLTCSVLSSFAIVLTRERERERAGC